MSQHTTWLKPQPLWQDAGDDYRQPDFFQPHLFRYDSDAFVEEFMAAAQSGNGALAGRVAQPAAAGQTLKLFQPIHGSFYLVSGSLCCVEPGFPQREVSLADAESTFFVLRKLIGGVEHGWIPANGSAAGWLPVDNGGRGLLEHEERLPLYPTAPRDGRTLLFGYIPVSSKESYSVGPSVLAQLAGEPESALTDPRADELQARFIDQATALVGMPTNRQIEPPPAPTTPIRLHMSVFALLDLWELLARPEVLPDVAAALRDNPDAGFSGPKAAEKAALMSFLKTRQWSASRTLASALGDVAKKQGQLNQSGADPCGAGLRQQLPAGQGARSSGDTLAQLASRPPCPPTPGPPSSCPRSTPGGEATYVLRCVYERPQCDPVQQVVSPQSQPFRLAAFFDPDAPARQVKIPLPTNVGLSDMRRFKKGVTFMISEPMQRKIAAITGKEEALLQDSSATSTRRTRAASPSSARFLSRSSSSSPSSCC
jgi:hypothetical protein